MTENEKKVMSCIVNSEYQDSPDVVGKPMWVDCISDDVGFSNRRTFSGTMASLKKKGYIETDGECCAITKEGFGALCLKS